MVSQLALFDDATAPALKPPLKWAGGKRWLAPHLQPIWVNHKSRRLVEPLCGGLAVTLKLLPSRALLSDINSHVVNYYRWLSRGLVVSIEMANDPDVYYMQRKRFNQLIRDGKAETQQAAELFYYLNRTGYNGLCRFNKRGEFNVPFGKYRTINYVRDFTSYESTLSGWEFISGDFENVPLQPGDFVYADPPYDVEFRHYSKEGFEWDDQVRLAEWLRDHEGPVVLSNQATDRVVDLYGRLGFDIQLLTAPRMINSTGDRTPAIEVLATRGL